MLGTFKNVEELEMYLTLDELEAILEAAREKELRDRRFFAALKGIDIDAGSGVDAKEKVEEMKRKVDALNSGVSSEQFEFDELGIDIEID